MQDMGDQGLIWRGQRKACWELQTSIQRAFKDGGVDEAERAGWEQRAFSYFRAQSVSYLPMYPEDTDLLEWLATMQHYGAPTRLLDWTESPFIGAYFAYRDMLPSQLEPAALWSYDARSSRDQLMNQVADLEFPAPRDLLADEGDRRPSWAEEINKLVRTYVESKSRIPLAVRPLRPDLRMTAQQTILTVDACLDKGVDYPMAGLEGKPLLFKFELPAEWRRKALRDLALMGITETSLFPGLEGVAQHSRRIVVDRFRDVWSELEGH